MSCLFQKVSCCVAHGAQYTVPGYTKRPHFKNTKVLKKEGWRRNVKRRRKGVPGGNGLDSGGERIKTIKT